MTCIDFSLHDFSGILCVGEPGQYLIRDGENQWRFEWSDRWGPLRVSKDGRTAGQPSWRSRFWTVTTIWAKQGKRTQPFGRETLAVWDQPPAAIYRYRQIGRRSRLLIDAIEPSGFIEGISEEIWENVGPA